MQAIDIRDILKASGLTKRVAFSVEASECGIGASYRSGVGLGGAGADLDGAGAKIAECVFDGPLAVQAELANVNGIVRVKANVRAAYRTFCARCLKALLVPIDKDFAEEFVDAQTARLADDMYTYAEKTLDMSEALRDMAMLEIPIRHLCSEECKALCPSCGKDRNEADCGCARADIGGNGSRSVAAENGLDARFSALLGYDETKS